MQFPDPWLYQGDCIEWLGLLPDASVDAVVTDPPYGLGKPPDPVEVMRAWCAGEEFQPRNKGGFMGRAWDAFVPGPELWSEVFRVLKPGGHVIAFAATRTVDWTSLALRFSGFEIRDQINWAYWCFDEETEILTDKGWARYDSPIIGRHALCFDADENTFQWGEISAQPVFDFDGLACRLQGPDGEQILSPGHRCVVERNGAYSFAYAGDLAREREARIPILEDLPGLLERLPVPNESAGIEEEVLQFGVLECSDLPTCTRTGATSQGGDLADFGMPRMRRRVRAAASLGQGSGAVSLLPGLQREEARKRSGAPFELGDGALLSSGSCQASSQDARGEQPWVEGGCHASPQARKLHVGRDSGSMPSRSVRHGSEQRLHSPASPRCSESDGAASGSSGGCASCRSRSKQQRCNQPHAVRDEQRPQAIRGARHTRASVVRVDRVAYRGKIWCVKVPTGAFVARRRGHVFVTGNSGYPKSTAVDRVIDQHLGVADQRKVVGRSKGGLAQRKDGHTVGGGDDVYNLTAPASPEAQRWEGWGSGMKPCFEPAVFARRPLIGSIAENVLAHGVGGINVAGCSFPPGSPEWLGPNGEMKKQMLRERKKGQNALSGRMDYNAGSFWVPKAYGRHPSNIVSVPKPSPNERERGTTGLPINESGSRNNHPTLKPVRLMRWLCRLVTPEGGLVIDPFSGSGTTGIAAALEGFRFAGSEMDEGFHRIASSRIQHARMSPRRWNDTRPTKASPW